MHTDNTQDGAEPSPASAGFPMPREYGRLCKKHGGVPLGGDESWCCDTCARGGINKCKCGGHARYFGEALMSSVTCEQCGDYVAGVDINEDIRALWNADRRCWITG